MTALIISFYEGKYAYEQFKKGLIRNEKLSKQNAQAQLAALKNQVNPHFLFNSIKYTNFSNP